MHTHRGFTLHELMIAIGIFSTVTAFSFSTFSDFIYRNKMDITASKFVHDLAFARGSSLNYNANITVCASDDLTSCKNTKDWAKSNIIIMLDRNANLLLDEDDRILKIINLSSETNSIIWSSFGNSSYLQWVGSGTTYFQNGNFTLCPTNKDPKLAKKIIMNAAGRLYFGLDKNHDGIQEGTDGKNIVCL